MKRPATPDLDDLRLFHALVEAGGFSAAARRLGIAKSTLSHRIAGLEAVVGAGLLRRSSRSLSVTDRGQALLPLAAAAARLHHEAEVAARRSGEVVAERIAISCSVVVAQRVLAPVLPRFLRDHPAIDVALHATNRHVDLYAEGFDIGLRVHHQPIGQMSLRKRTIAAVPWSLAAAPAYLEAEGDPRDPADLARHAIGWFGPHGAEARWTFARGDAATTIELAPRLRINDMAGLLDMAAGGLGIVGLPRYLMADHVADGRLRHVLTGWTMPGGELSILTPPRGQGSPAVALFADFMARELPAILTPTG